MARLLYIHQYFGTPRSSGGTRSYEQARAMQAAGFDVVMLTSSAHLAPEEVPAGEGICRRGVIEGINCIVLDIPYNQHMSYRQRIMTFLKFMAWCCRIVLTEPRIDLVFATSTPLTVGVPALVGKLIRGVPYVFEVRDLWPDVPMEMGILRPGLIAKALKWAEHMIYRHARLWVPVNAGVARVMAAGVRPAKPMAIVPNACDTYLFDPSRDGRWFRREQGLDDAIVCVHTGAMGTVNGLDGILDAAVALRDEPRIRIVLIGGGNQRDRLVQRVADETIDNVLILDGMPKEQLADVLATADIGLMTVKALPVLEKNCANKFADYLASGLPIVLNYRGWQAELLERFGAGLSADQGDAAGFVGAIRRLAGDADLRGRLARGGRRLAETEMNRQTLVAPMLEAMTAITESAG